MWKNSSAVRKLNIGVQKRNKLSLNKVWPKKKCIFLPERPGDFHPPIWLENRYLKPFILFKKPNEIKTWMDQKTQSF